MKEEIGYPYILLPEDMFHHTAGGYGGEGTLCGAIGSCAAIINLVAYDNNKTHSKLVADLINWYSQQTFPTKMFDSIATYKDQVQVAPGSPLCHVSASTWMQAAEVSYKDKPRKDRCAKVTAATAYRTIEILNQHLEGKYAFIGPVHTEETEECLSCHGKKAAYTEKGLNDCLDCHDDHTK
ncbi:MAG: C-GCAxxG-C-C family protein [Desulfuromusa sp.]|nr:C-GCAxxG-C-C family protein [Desulfuromusa sp.]